MRVFAGPRDDAFYFDSGADLRSPGLPRPRACFGRHCRYGTGAAYPNAVDDFPGYNISLIAVEMPIAWSLPNSAVPTSSTDPNATIGAWAATLRQLVTVRPSPSDPINYGEYVQVDRVGNPLTVELLIPLPMKDYWNRSDPSGDQQFASLIADPFFVSSVLNGVFDAKCAPGAAQRPAGCVRPRHHAHRPDHAQNPNAQQSRLGPLGGDNAGWPFGGRRPGDDVVDIGLRAAAGVLVSGFNIAPNNELGDGVNSDDNPVARSLPIPCSPACRLPASARRMAPNRPWHAYGTVRS